MSGGSDAMILVWDQNSFSQVNSLSGHEGSVFTMESIYFDNTYIIVSGGKESRIMFWNLDTMENVGAFSFYYSPVTYIKTIPTDNSVMVVYTTFGEVYNLVGSASSVQLETKQTYYDIIPQYPCNGLEFTDHYLVLSSQSDKVIKMDFKKSPAAIYQTFGVMDIQTSIELIDGNITKL